MDINDQMLSKFKNFINDLIKVFPEHSELIQTNYKDILELNKLVIDDNKFPGVKNSVRVATTANGTLASAFANSSTVDGVTLATNDRILIKDQSTGSENGIYTVNASGAPTRATDFDSNSEVTGGAFFFAEEGTTNADNGFVLTNDGAITVGTTALTFTQFSGAGQVIAGSALTKSGNTLNVAVDPSSEV